MTNGGKTKRRPVRLICLTGADGSGKTTLARSVSDYLQARGHKVRYVHGILIKQFLLDIVKPIAQRIFMRGTDERANYAHYSGVKAAASRRHPILSAMYGGIWYLDYWIEALRRVTLPVFRGELVVADRYIYDLLLNISLATARPVDKLSWLLNIFFLCNPKPDIVFLVDTPEEVALARKSDIHSIDYLRERRSEYLRMADRFGFQVLDGQAAPEQLVKEVLARSLGLAYDSAQEHVRPPNA